MHRHARRRALCTTTAFSSRVVTGPIKTESVVVLSLKRQPSPSIGSDPYSLSARPNTCTGTATTRTNRDDALAHPHELESAQYVTNGPIARTCKPKMTERSGSLYGGAVGFTGNDEAAEAG